MYIDCIHGLQEELKILRLRYSLLVEEEMETREKELNRLMEHKKAMKVFIERLCPTQMTCYWLPCVTLGGMYLINLFVNCSKFFSTSRSIVFWMSSLLSMIQTTLSPIKLKLPQYLSYLQINLQRPHNTRFYINIVIITVLCDFKHLLFFTRLWQPQLWWSPRNTWTPSEGTTTIWMRRTRWWTKRSSVNSTTSRQFNRISCTGCSGRGPGL